MISLKLIISCLIGLQLLMLPLIYFSKDVLTTQKHRELHNLRSEGSEVQNTEQPEQDVPSYRFTSPVLAYKILSQLDVLEPSRRDGYRGKTRGPMPYLHLKSYDRYCEKHREHIVEFPETIFDQINVIQDGWHHIVMRSKVTPPIANDIQPHIGVQIHNTTTNVYNIRPEVTLFLTRNELYDEHRIGQHFSCMTQASSRFPNYQVLDVKDEFVESLKEYAKKYEDRPQCFNFTQFFPETYLLYRKQECLDFFQKFNSPEYQILKEERKIVYIRKLGANIHMGQGVDPVTEEKEQELRALYDNGSKCGQVNTKYFVQNYIHNPLLVEGRKFDFRLYILVASTNPLMAYYHDGFLRVTLDNYDPNSNDKRVLLTNLALTEEVAMNARRGILYKGMNADEILHSQQWSYQRLQNYLLETNKITDSNWLENYLRPQFMKAFAHLLRFSLSNLYKHSSLFQLYGVDFMLDDNLNVWFIEANSKPGLDGYSESMEKFIVKMLQDHIQLVTGLLRSRTKRIVRYVNTMIKEGDVQDNGNGGVVIKDLEQRRMEFKEITKNYFEKEFEPDVTNGFRKVIDENYDGLEIYQGLIEEGCL